MDRILSSNSLVNSGNTMRVAATELASRFAPRALVEDVVRAVGVVAEAPREMTRDPRILLATTGQLPSTARLALELHDAGARVSLIAPSNHPAWTLDLFQHRVTYRALAPCRGLEAALRRLQPDIVIPCDERTVRDLQAVAQATKHHDIKRLIEGSTAPAENFPIITSRTALLAVAQQHGVRVPPSMPLSDVDALDRWTANHAAPFVLKADGSWAGFGVRIISNAATAKDAYARMVRPVSARMALRESALEGNHFEIRTCLRRERPAISVQGYVDGWPANIGVACWQGEVLAATCAEAIATTSATGPSTITRIIQNAEMIDAATRVVRALGLSGMIGFDFMIEAASGAAYLIEMNPRNTPICAIRLGPGRDLAEALVARIAGRPVRDRPARTERDVVVFFPDTWQEDPASHFLHSGYHDVPWEQPDLVRTLMLPSRRERSWFWRVLRRAWLRLNASQESAR
jgi:carbamoylphosphate synthase large subunit